MICRVPKLNRAIIIIFIVGIVFLAGFYIFQVGQVQAGHTVEFTADVILDLTGLDTTTYLASGSKADSLTISGANLNVYGIWDGITFLLKTADHKVLQITPSGGTADLTFSSDYVGNDYVYQWTENSSVSVTHVLGVPKPDTNYTVKAGGLVIEGSPFDSGVDAEITFTRTGGGSEVFTVSGPGYGLCEEHNVGGYAWSENVGWVSFSCQNENALMEGTEYGVDSVSTSTGWISGQAWSSNVGWISFDSSKTGAPPAAPDYSGSGYIAKISTTTLEVSGWGRALSSSST